MKLKNYKAFLFPKINFLNLLFGLYPPHPGLIFQKSDYDDLNYYDENFKICSDFDFYLKIYKSNFIIKYIKGDTWALSSEIKISKIKN